MIDPECEGLVTISHQADLDVLRQKQHAGVLAATSVSTCLSQ